MYLKGNVPLSHTYTHSQLKHVEQLLSLTLDREEEKDETSQSPLGCGWSHHSLPFQSFSKLLVWTELQI